MVEGGSSRAPERGRTGVVGNTGSSGRLYSAETAETAETCMTTKENPLAAAAGSPGPGQAQACFCGFGRSAVLGAARRVDGGTGRAARTRWSAVLAGG